MSDRSRKQKLEVAPEVFAWLDADTIGWREALTGRIGPRFELMAADDLEREDVRVSRA